MMEEANITSYLRDLTYRSEQTYTLLTPCFLIKTALQGVHFACYPYEKWLRVTDCHLTLF